MFRKLTLSLVVLLVGGVVLRADTAVAIDQAACCLPTTSRLDALMNPTRGGDEKFFSRPGGPPNVLFVIDTSGSMHGWPRPWSATRGCSDSFLNKLGYNKDTQYDRLWTGLSTQSNDWFANAKYYDAPDNGYGVLFGSTPAGGNWTTASAACSALDSKISTDDLGECQQCLDTQGYYVYDGSRRRVKGNFLNFYAPRDSGAVKVLADVVRDLREVRFGVMGFETRAAKTCWGRNAGTGAQCLCIQQPMGPTCAKSFPLDSSSVENNRNSVLNGLTNVNASNNNGLAWGSCATPLSDALYAAGYFFQSKAAPTPFSSYLGSHPTSTNFSAADGVCFECGFNAIILLTDGEPKQEGDVVKLPSAITNDTTPCVGCSTSNLHKVAKFLWEKDLRFDMAGQQRVATYTIGFSDDVSDSKLLQEAARLGGGRFSSARSTKELKNAILSILDEINARNTSFSSAAISTLQTQSEALTAIVPRMLPTKDGTWTGKLYRYQLFNEFVEDKDKNVDGDRGDVLIVDKSGSVVAEDSSSDYRKLLSQNGGPGGAPVFGADAEPFWEASKVLQNVTTHSGRNIFTVTDNGGGTNKDGLLNHQDDLVPFNLANMGKLRQYLAVGGAPLCPTGSGTTYKPGLILTRMQMPLQTDLGKAASLMIAAGLTSLPAAPTTQDYDLLCTALVIQYVRGQDLFDEDVDDSRSDTRPSVLGDIFHSSPVMVDPPADKFICDLGVGNQCVRTLYSIPNDKTGMGATPMAEPRELPATCETGSTATKLRDPYDSYQYVHRQRERLILVGANDGMLHAFSDGMGQLKDAKTCDYQYAGQSSDGGTERWAFIPPDLLPRLQELLQGHTYFVDGDIMVRDIWADVNGDGKKSWDEYRTMAVVAEGRGGIHYFALELKWESDGKTALGTKTPAFRWMFPQPCTDEAQRFGKTLLSLNPKPPPIGPVLLASDNGQARHGLTGPKSVERWVAMLTGGWSPGNEKGRGIYMVDVWNGTVNGRRDNLLWKWEFVDPGSSGTPVNPDDPRKAMVYGFAAPVAMADYGANGKAGFDGFFDTAVVGDLGGQLWTLRFFQPGVLDSTTKLITNWSGARSFVMDRDGATVSNPSSIRSRAPYYYLSSLVVQPDNKALRAYVGTGNRYSLLDTKAGTCRFDNPQACSKMGCSQTQVGYKLTRGTDYQRLNNEWADRLYKTGRHVAFSGTQPTDYCGAQSSTFLKAEFESRGAVMCPKPTGTGSVSYDFARTQVQCGQDASGVFDCRVTDPGNTLNMNDLDLSASSTPSTLGKNRFYGIWVYGGPADRTERTFDENTAGVSSNVARDFDARRLTDTGKTAGSGDLVNVTNVQCDAQGNCKCAAGMTCGSKLLSGPEDYGWFYEYEGLEHKTASGSAVLASCAIWNSMYPGPSTSGPCAGSSSNLARLFQGDFISGAPNCAAGFLDNSTGYARYQSRSVVAPPPEPATAIQVSKSGQVKYSTMFIEPGRAQASEVAVSASSDVLQYIYELPISKGLHTCRHDSINGGQASCIPSEM
ncbi:pilus assembly protein PilY [Archangium sp.]|uniref:pilus assembly protein PilY n=1 Tax=Archangium sp. TaxID=1872627 RepID=UPI002D5F5306|nr:pilus assembly protein PilY [Archangium sp.]HYO59488.1 pilus assembly protein PilY [Archangium sp.]